MSNILVFWYTKAQFAGGKRATFPAMGPPPSTQFNFIAILFFIIVVHTFCLVAFSPPSHVSVLDPYGAPLPPLPPTNKSFAPCADASAGKRRSYRECAGDGGWRRREF